MPTSIKHFTLQAAILVSWLVFVIFPTVNKNVEAQNTCPNIKYLAPLPGWIGLPGIQTRRSQWEHLPLPGKG